MAASSTSKSRLADLIAPGDPETHPKTISFDGKFDDLDDLGYPYFRKRRKRPCSCVDDFELLRMSQDTEGGRRVS